MSGVRYDSSIPIERRFPSIQGMCSYRCGTPLPKGRRRWCSSSCGERASNEHLILCGHPGVIRQQVYLRDRGVCARCKADTEADRRKWLAEHKTGTYLYPFTRHAWEAHHIVAVAEGGGGCGLEGYETLCIACHKVETAALRARLSRKAPPPDHPLLAL